MSTPKRPGAWRACARCERKMRNDGRERCWRCRENRCINPEVSRKPSIHDARLVMNDAMLWAGVCRHDMAPAEQDEADGFISYCLKCDGFLVVDLWEQPTAYGNVTKGPGCPGKPPHPPAQRREPTIQAAPYIEPEVVCTWTQDEIAWVRMMVPSSPEVVS